ncbi:hypothetical protein K6Y31_14505 [Motilimonas cestriensis]|uniref:Chemotaxis methyl-accepting receptor HlyB-like 4HB MCP domain-containing protein n=1 Tax=Motilimonas cestriensis TaxID=2742685 RepID=A0ABS8WEG2_9GAMM|nr:hypothetical protein [Motilimonas cestriensis]MCE2596021.1 hypothetical protein [Motilimonas cestriensis]
MPKTLPIKAAVKKLDNSDLIKTGFWVGQVFMLIATMLGVYLASQEGMSQAMTFNDINTLQDNYHLRRSLRDEFSDNINKLDETIAFLRQGHTYFAEKDQPKFDTYVWQAMRFSPRTMETPAPILTGVRRFHSEVDDLLMRLDKKYLGRSLITERLEAVSKQAREETLTYLEADLINIKQVLLSYDVDVDQVLSYQAK